MNMILFLYILWNGGDIETVRAQVGIDSQFHIHHYQDNYPALFHLINSNLN